ncbi:mitochondrial amidoxime reducing component 2-like [Thrips palmi]|uniref:Mitochondrial amidoxime reducing component 2-like n=1 Tax=Thrips palmi TaxID=161013 RepID=A0A6P8Z6C3_THRPL|nr:mitochondrial amidoxime reducing component 2-like [Thrips palmi]
MHRLEMQIFRKLSNGHSVAFAAVAVVGVAALGVAVTRRLLKHKIPADSEWRRVGTLSELYLFPLKSGKPVAADKLTAREAGPTLGLLRDRSFVAVDRNGRFVTGRSHTGLMTVSVVAVAKAVAGQDGDQNQDVVEMRSPLADQPLILDTAQLKTQTCRKITVWGSAVSAVDCGDEAAAFIRQVAVDPDRFR